MNLGMTSLYHVDVTINQDLKALFVNPNIDSLFLKLWFDGEKALFELLGSGSTVKGVKLTDLQELHIKVPPTLSEQQAIASILSSMDDEIASLEAKLAKARSIKKGMMEQLLTGRIRLVPENRRAGLPQHETDSNRFFSMAGEGRRAPSAALEGHRASSTAIDKRKHEAFRHGTLQ